MPRAQTCTHTHTEGGAAGAGFHPEPRMPHLVDGHRVVAGAVWVACEEGGIVQQLAGVVGYAAAAGDGRRRKRAVAARRAGRARDDRAGRQRWPAAVNAILQIQPAPVAMCARRARS